MEFVSIDLVTIGFIGYKSVLLFLQSDNKNRTTSWLMVTMVVFSTFVFRVGESMWWTVSTIQSFKYAYLFNPLIYTLLYIPFDLLSGFIVIRDKKLSKEVIAHPVAYIGLQSALMVGFYLLIVFLALIIYCIDVYFNLS